MIRLFDIIISFIGIFILVPLFLLVVFVAFIDTGSPIFRQVRLGKNKKEFVLLKFRTMKVGTASVPTHLVGTASISTIGRLLRRTKLDELPQLWNVLFGDMTLVGPRPGLPNQEDLIAARSSRGVYAVRPGITGLAQISGIDMSNPNLLAELDYKMIETLTLRTYFKYIILTLLGRGFGDRVSKK